MSRLAEIEARADVPFLLERLREAMRIFHYSHNSRASVDECRACQAWLEEL